MKEFRKKVFSEFVKELDIPLSAFPGLLNDDLLIQKTELAANRLSSIDDSELHAFCYLIYKMSLEDAYEKFCTIKDDVNRTSFKQYGSNYWRKYKTRLKNDTGIKERINELSKDWSMGTLLTEKDITRQIMDVIQEHIKV